jgi:hypothetical protein
MRKEFGKDAERSFVTSFKPLFQNLHLEIDEHPKIFGWSGEE